jgi:hypothetical protein
LELDYDKTDSTIDPKLSTLSPLSEANKGNDNIDNEFSLNEEPQLSNLKRSRSSSTVNGQAPTAKRARISTYTKAASMAQDAVNTLTQGLEKAVSNLKAGGGGPQTRMTECIEILTVMEAQNKITEMEYFEIYNYLKENVPDTLLFYGMPEKFKMNWLKRTVLRRFDEPDYAFD